MDKTTENLELLNKVDLNREDISQLQKLKGMVAAFAWVFTAVGSASCVTLLERQVPDFELNIARCSTAFIISSLVRFNSFIFHYC